MKQLRQYTWDNQTGFDDTGQEIHTHKIKPHLGPWTSCKKNSRLKEVTLTRHRTGRTRFNEPWIDNRQQCAFCNTCTEPSVKHILLECCHFDLHRRHITAYCRKEKIPLNVAHLLGDNHPELLKLLFQYLRDTNLAGAL